MKNMPVSFLALVHDAVTRDSENGVVQEQIAQAVALRAQEIQREQGLSDSESIDAAMSDTEYARIIRGVLAKFREEERELQAKKRKEDQLRAQNKPTLSAKLGDVAKLSALRDKLPEGR